MKLALKARTNNNLSSEKNEKLVTQPWTWDQAPFGRSTKKIGKQNKHSEGHPFHYSIPCSVCLLLGTCPVNYSRFYPTKEPGLRLLISMQNNLTRNVLLQARTLRRSFKYIVQVFKVNLTAPSLIKESQSLAIFFLAEAALFRYNWPVKYNVQCKYYNTVERLPNFQNKPFLTF